MTLFFFFFLQVLYLVSVQNLGMGEAQQGYQVTHQPPSTAYLLIRVLSAPNTPNTTQEAH